MLKSACTAGTVRSLFRILLVLKSCIFKLACAVTYGFLSDPWVDYTKAYIKQGRDLAFVM